MQFTEEQLANCLIYAQALLECNFILLLIVSVRSVSKMLTVREIRRR